MLGFNYSTIIDPLLRDVRNYIPKFTEMKKGHRGLDVCCGTGEQIFHYAKRGITATGIDTNPTMIDIAKRKKEGLGLNNIFFRTEDAKQLSFEDNYFDFASISLALHEIGISGRHQVISEMKRVVKKRGFLVFVDFRSPLPNNITSFFIRTVEHLAPKNHFENFKSYLTRGGLPFLLKKNRLKQLRIDHLKQRALTIIKARNN